MAYIGLPLETDGNILASDMLTRLMSDMPGWVPREGHLEVWMIETVANALAEVLGVATRVDRNIFKYYGESLVNVPIIDGAPASAPTTWVLTDTLGHTIPAGTTVAYRTSTGVLVPFVTASDVTVAAGSNTTGPGEVIVYALENGVDGNDFAAGSMVVLDSLVFVSSVTSTAVSSGGIDAETDDEYLDRLVDELRLFAPRPILAADFATFARKVEGVDRATGVDNYNPDDDTFDNEKMVTIAVVDSNGDDVSPAIKADVVDLFEATREVNFVVNVIDAERTTIDIAYVVVARPGRDVAVIKSAIDAGLEAFVDPAQWGSTPDEPNMWTNEVLVRYLSVAEVVLSVEGVAYISTLTVNGGTTDVTMSGVIALPTPGTIGGTVT